MNPKLSSCLCIFNLIYILKSLILIEAANGPIRPQDFYDSCNVTYSCGSGLITGIGYPFRGSTDPAFCGHPGFVLECNTQNNYTFIQVINARFLVLAIDQTSQTMALVRDDMILGSCPHEMANTTLDFSIFNYASSCTNYTFLYGCRDSDDLSATSTCPNDGSVHVVQGNQGPHEDCDYSVIVPVSLSGAEARIDQVLWSGFEVTWTMDSGPCRDCRDSNGRCGYDYGKNQTTCLCPNSPPVSNYSCPVDDQNLSRPDTVPSPGNDSRRRGMEIGLPIAAAVLAGVIVGWFIFYVRQVRKQRVAPKSSQTIIEFKPSPSSKQLLSSTSATFTRSIPSFPSERSSEFGRDVSYFGVQVFDYTELEEATDNFNASRELGDGGFGTVYYGKLQDGRKIAVKRLYENNFKRVEQFMNEVEILARLRHEHLVTLYGCTPKRSRELLLVYEYVPNGTVADHLHGNRAKSGLLCWPIRLNIAIETAEALTYLHRSDIIHRDVKTTNVLLDNDFHVKVADFGLSRLFPTNVTHVSTAPQGTPGYVDPEYYQCYHLTEKSDVYSFGVMMIELISSLQAVDTNRHRHDINLSNMAINKIQSRQLHELVDSSLGYETNSCVRRMITLVAELAFRCLQQDRDMRPTMEEVLEGLRRIQNDDPNEHMVEIDITGDEDVDQLDCSIDLPSPVSVAT